jgi:hypothetical protein
MPVILDGSPMGLSDPRPTLASALAAARTAAESRRRVITDILLDGRPVPDDALAAQPEEHPLAPAAELRFVSADPIDLVQTSLRDAAEALDTIDTHQQAASQALQTGQFDKAMPSLSEAFTTWDTARKVLTDGCTLLGLNPETLAVEIDGSAVPVAGAVRLLLVRLTEIKRCLTAQDWCGLSDTLAYDLPADAKLWRAMLRGLADRLPELR